MEIERYFWVTVALFAGVMAIGIGVNLVHDIMDHWRHR